MHVLLCFNSGTDSSLETYLMCWKLIGNNLYENVLIIMFQTVGDYRK